MTLKKITALKAGEKGAVKEFENKDLILKLLEMGFLPGTPIQLIRKAPMGSPLYVKINNKYFIALRKDEADSILIEED